MIVKIAALIIMALAIATIVLMMLGGHASSRLVAEWAFVAFVTNLATLLRRNP